MPSTTNVMAGMPKGQGAIFRAPLGTALPTSAKGELPAAFVELGYVSNEGWARNISKSYNAHTAWGGDEVHKTRSEHSVGFTFALIENLRSDAQKAKWGEAAVEQNGAEITVTYDGAEPEPSVWVIDMVDGSNKFHRVVFANAQDTTESFEQTFSSEDLIALPFEMSVYRDETLGGFFQDHLLDGSVTTGV